MANREYDEWDEPSNEWDDSNQPEKNNSGKKLNLKFKLNSKSISIFAGLIGSSLNEIFKLLNEVKVVEATILLYVIAFVPTVTMGTVLTAPETVPDREAIF